MIFVTVFYTYFMNDLLLVLHGFTIKLINELNCMCSLNKRVGPGVGPTKTCEVPISAGQGSNYKSFEVQ